MPHKGTKGTYVVRPGHMPKGSKAGQKVKGK